MALGYSTRLHYSIVYGLAVFLVAAAGKLTLFLDFLRRMRRQGMVQRAKQKGLTLVVSG